MVAQTCFQKPKDFEGHFFFILRRFHSSRNPNILINEKDDVL
jgi:hypothetical protein